MRRTLLRIAAIAALIFGLLTIRSGAGVLFGDPLEVERAGAVVPFILWFNFAAGFVYVAASIGLWLLRRWAVWLAVAIAFATVIAFALFGIHVAQGGSYETRTMLAMAVRSSFWMVIAALSCWTIDCLPRHIKGR
jgi:hypothetical protein